MSFDDILDDRMTPLPEEASPTADNTATIEDAPEILEIIELLEEGELETRKLHATPPKATFIDLREDDDDSEAEEDDDEADDDVMAHGDTDLDPKIQIEVETDDNEDDDDALAPVKAIAPAKVVDAVEPVEFAGTLKGRIEAVLFITNRPLDVGEITERLHARYEDVEEALLELINDYSFREDSALEIDDRDGYILQIRDTYSDVVNAMLPAEISTAALRTLSAIALKGPILQSKLVEIRGSTAYDHIRELVKEKLVSKNRNQQSYLLRVTPKFHRYFRIDENSLTQILFDRDD